MTINNIPKYLIILLGALYVFAVNVNAEEPPNSADIYKEISNRISEEYVTCAAYFSLVREGLLRSNDIKTAEKYKISFDNALQYALLAAQEGRTEEMAEKVTSARLELSVKTMLKEIDNNFSNISILMNSHLYHCKEVMENPDKIFSDCTEKVLKKYQTIKE